MQDQTYPYPKSFLNFKISYWTKLPKNPKESSMIIGIGMDVIAIKRIEKGLARFNQRFLERFFTPCERDFAFSRKSAISTLAKRFAAKEACAKALGTGLSQGISWQDIEVVQQRHGQPGLKLHNTALKVLQQRIPTSFQAQIHLSLSDDPTNAYAMVVISAEQDKE